MTHPILSANALPPPRSLRGRRDAPALLALLAGALWPVSAMAYRTTADLDEFDGSVARWSTPSVSFHFAPLDVPGLSSVDVEKAVVAGWQAWEQPVCTNVDVINLGVMGSAAPGDGINTIEWISDWSKRGFEPSAAGLSDVQYSRVDGDAWNIVEADIYFNAEHFRWRVGPGADDRQDVAIVAMHEMGHALGLLHPCEPDGEDGAPRCGEDPDDRNSIMYPGYAVDRDALSADDQAGICFLYRQPSCKTTGCPKGLECTKRGCEAVCDPACDSDEVCQAGVCVPELFADSRTECSDMDECSQPPANRGLFGDPCEADVDCVSSFCAKGSCSERCTVDEQCTAPTTECRDGTCVSRLAGLGESCSESKECLGAQCLSIDGEPAVCTRECQGDLGCPGIWTCETLEGRSVCIPPGPPYIGGGGGCTMQPLHATHHRTGLMLAGGFFALCCLSRRRRLPRVARRSAQNCTSDSL